MTERDKQRQEEERRGRQGLRAVAASLPAILKPLAAERGASLVALQLDWPEIVGAEIAERCRPLELRLGSGRAEGMLTVKAESGFALELQHLAPQVLERINGHFGYRAVVRLRVRQGPLGGPETSARRPA